MSEQEFRRSVRRGTDIDDFLIDRFRGFIAVHPCDAEVGDVGWAIGGGEKDI